MYCIPFIPGFIVHVVLILSIKIFTIKSFVSNWFRPCTSSVHSYLILTTQVQLSVYFFNRWLTSMSIKRDASPTESSSVCSTRSPTRKSPSLDFPSKKTQATQGKTTTIFFVINVHVCWYCVDVGCCLVLK